jgi:hypothetical protein
MLASGFTGMGPALDGMPTKVYLGPRQSIPIPLDHEGQEYWWVMLDWYEMDDAE